MGRYLEAWMLTKIIEKSELLGYKFIIGQLIKTKKNLPVMNFYSDYGFKPLNSNEIKTLNFNPKSKNLYKRLTKDKIVLNGDIYEKN